MTLVISIVNEHGLWSATDRRLINVATGKVLPNATAKQMGVICPDGSAVIAYAGVGAVLHVPMYQWMLNVMRGEPRSLKASLDDLTEQATFAYGNFFKRRNLAHMFAVTYATPMGCGVAVISNTVTYDFAAVDTELNDYFQMFEPGPFPTEQNQVIVPMYASLVTGSGRAAISHKDLEVIQAVASRKPRDHMEFVHLLRSIMQRAAHSRQPGSKTITGAGSCVYMEYPDWSVLTESHNVNLDAPQEAEFATIHFGIDMDAVYYKQKALPAKGRKSSKRP